MNTSKLNQRIGGKKQLGQGMTEYIIIVALVAIAAIGVYSAFGRTLEAQVAQVTNGVAGQTSGVTANAGLAKSESAVATKDANNKNGLDVYGQSVTQQ